MSINPYSKIYCRLWCQSENIFAQWENQNTFLDLIDKNIFLPRSTWTSVVAWSKEPQDCRKCRNGAKFFLSDGPHTSE